MAAKLSELKCVTFPFGHSLTFLFVAIELDCHLSRLTSLKNSS